MSSINKSTSTQKTSTSGPKTIVRVTPVNIVDVAICGGVAALATGIVCAIQRKHFDKKFEELGREVNNVGAIIDKYWYCEHRA